MALWMPVSLTSLYVKKYDDISLDVSKTDPSYWLLLSGLIIFRRWHVDRTAFLQKGEKLFGRKPTISLEVLGGCAAGSR